MIDFTNILVISGAGQNVGKTWLACRLINRYARHRITGIKISPHFHSLCEGAEYLENKPEYQIIRETKTGRKDSMLMLKAGAQEVFYIQTREQFIGEAFKKLLRYVDPSSPLIIESGLLDGIYEQSTCVYLNEKEEAESLLQKIEYKNHWIIHE